jgi:hypothetical protein
VSAILLHFTYVAPASQRCDPGRSQRRDWPVYMAQSGRSALQH